ncbi:MAG: hypothetical protein ACLT98_01785 [Eggerthellaceae bacterium]
MAKGASSAAFKASHAATARAANTSRPKMRQAPNALNEQVRIPLPEGKHTTLTRRQLIVGAAGIGALFAIGAGAQVATTAKEASSTVATLEVSEDAVVSLSDEGALSAIEGDAPLALSGEYKLPYGSLVWANSDSYAACLLPTEGADPLCQGAILNLSDGTLTTILEAPVSTERGFDICDIRCNEHGVVWTEANCLSGEWRIYQASASGTSIGSPVLVETGTSDYEIPYLCTAGNRAFWQVVPASSGNASAEDSLLKSASFGSSDIREDWRSRGRMGTAPYSTGDEVVITPRVDTTGVYYQMTLLDADSGSKKDELTLPTPMKPLDAGYVDGRFTFSFDASYQNQGGLSGIGRLPLSMRRIDRVGMVLLRPKPYCSPAWSDPISWSNQPAGQRNRLCHANLFHPAVSRRMRRLRRFPCIHGHHDAIVTYLAMPSDDDAHTLVRVWKA